MEINLQARYTLETENGKIVLCFKHAVQAASKGKDVQVEIDEYGSTGDMRSLHCRTCFEERQAHQQEELNWEETNET